MLFVLATLIALCSAYKSGIYRSKLFYFNMVLLGLVGLMQAIELTIFDKSISILHSDRAYFIEISALTIKELFYGVSRYALIGLWYKEILFWYPEWFIGPSLAPFFVIFISLLYTISNRNNWALFLFPFMLAYYYYLPFYGYRDIIIHCLILLTAQTISKQVKAGNVIIITISLTSLWFLRYQYTLLLLVCIFGYIIVRNIRDAPTIKSTGIRLAITFAISFAGIMFLLHTNTLDDIRALTERYTETRDPEVTQWLLGENTMAIVRQLLTPLPTSLIERISIAAQDEVIGVVRDITRATMMVFFFLAIIFLACKPRLAINLALCNNSYLFLVLFAIGNTYLYSIYGDGGGASRNKTFPILLALLLTAHILRDRLGRLVLRP